MHGAKQLFAWMIRRFVAAHFDVNLISLRSPDRSEDRLEDHGIDVTSLSRLRFYPLTLPARLVGLDRRRTEILYSHGYGATTFGRLAAARCDWPTLPHEHAKLTDTPWFQKVADRLLALYARLAGAVSRSRAVDATRLVIDQAANVHFCIGGEGKLLSDLDQQPRRGGVVERARFAGFPRHVDGAFAAFDVLVFPSLRKGTPLTAFEALGGERPIVASDADGVTDILHDGSDASIVPRDPGALARAVLVLLGAPHRHDDLLGAARVTGAAYDLTVFVRKMHQLYQLVDQRRHTGVRSHLSETDMSFLSPTGHPLECSR